MSSEKLIFFFVNGCECKELSPGKKDDREGGEVLVCRVRLQLGPLLSLFMRWGGVVVGDAGMRRTPTIVGGSILMNSGII